MKYGILTYNNRPMRNKIKNSLNLGDPIQSYAMKYIYSKMGINENDLVEVSRYNTKSYNGDYIVLPFNCFNIIYNQFGYPYETLPLSPKIIPVFLSFHLHSRVIDPVIIENLKNFQPIGCRDEETMENLRKHGLISWLSGCVTLLLPKRKNIPKNEKVFLVDIPQQLNKYIPKEILENAEYINHQPSFLRISNSNRMSEKEYKIFYDFSINMLKRYQEEATLIVTSRLHAASPCIAMGIPVILVSNNFDGRFSFIDKYLPLYTPDLFHCIDWKPKVINYEVEKEQIIQSFIGRIEEVYTKYKKIYDISTFYEKRKKNIYNLSLIEEFKKLPIYKKNVKIALWGIINQTLILKNAIQDHCKEWLLDIVIDKATSGKFEGIEIKSPEEIKLLDTDIIYFVIPQSAHKEAKVLLRNLNLRFILLNNWHFDYYDKLI